MEGNLSGNIWKYTLLLITNKRVFVAILGAYYLTIPDVTPQIIGLILLASSLSSFILEIPSGYISDKIGHKKALVIAKALAIVATLLLLFADSIPLLIMATIFSSASFAFLSGTGSAFMHETLRALGRDHEYTKIIGKASAIGFAVPVVFMVLVPFLIDISYKLPFLVSLIFDVIGLLVAISLVTPPVKQQSIEEIGPNNFKEVMQEGCRFNYFSLALFSGVVGGFVFGIHGFRGPYQVFLEIPVIWFGVLFGIGRIGASILLAYSGQIKSYTNLLSFYKFQIIAYTFLIILLGLTANWMVVVAVFIITNALKWGLGTVDEGYRLDLIKTSKFKATLLSVKSQIESGFIGVIGVSLGFMIERLSYQTSFLYVTIIYVIVIIPMYFYIARKYKAGAYKILLK